jgi:hypothetical protein
MPQPLLTHGCGGTLVEYLVGNLKVEDALSTCESMFFRYTAGKFRWRGKLSRNFFCSSMNSVCVTRFGKQKITLWLVTQQYPRNPLTHPPAPSNFNQLILTLIFSKLCTAYASVSMFLYDILIPGLCKHLHNAHSHWIAFSCLKGTVPRD